MIQGRALLFSSMLMIGSTPIWSKNNPPEVVYPTTQDQQSLEQLLKDHSSTEQPQPAPAVAAPTTLPVPTKEEPHPQPLSRRERGAQQVPNPLPPGEGPATRVAGGEAHKVPPTYRVWIWQDNGDTLWRIAQKVYGDKDKWPLIYAANRDIIKDPNKIYPKQVLKIPPVDWQP